MARLVRQARHGFGDDGSDASPHLRGRPVTRLVEWLTPRITVGFAAVVLIGILVFSAAGFVGAAAALPYRAGWAGVPGTASLAVCTGEPQNVHCSATFTGDGGRPTVEHAVVDGHGRVGARDQPARLHPDGHTVSLVTPSGLVFLIAELFGLLVGIVLSAGFLAIGVHATARRWLGRPQPMTYRRELRAISVTCGIASVAAIALYLVARALVG
ncbi:MAG TPA: hypothetical protein VJX10_12185 [Pseudonocardiaceae bacterium]|nr:hypothetical protein [Pseudonocardiaceae bacterium]